MSRDDGTSRVRGGAVARRVDERRPERRRTRLVIFDCDGVLVDSEEISNRVLAQMLGEHGVAMTTAQARATFQGMRLDGVLAHARTLTGQRLREDWLHRYEQIRDVVFGEELQAIDGARETIEELLAAGLSACVASQGKLSKTKRSLELAGLDELFPTGARFSAHSVPRGKPDPDLFLAAAAAMGAAPTECVVVEDSASGVLAASRARMRAIGYAADSDANALLRAGAEVAIVSLAELPPLLLGLG